MQMYYMLGKYSHEALKKITATRTEECTRMIEKFGGEIILMHALMGEYDLALIINFSSNADALKASLALGKMTGISFSTYPAVTISDFDRIAGQI